MNIVEQSAASIGTAVMSVILAALLAGKFGVPTAQGQLAATAAILNPQSHAAATGLAAEAFSTTFVWSLVLVVLCVIPALVLPKTKPAVAPSEGDEVTPPAMVH